jgi:hypothetical protein
MRRSPSAISDALATKHSAMSFTPFGLYLARGEHRGAFVLSLPRDRKYNS